MENHIGTETANTASHPAEDNPTIEQTDPELEVEFQELAQWLLDVYIWRLQQERKVRGPGEVDSRPSSPTMR